MIIVESIFEALQSLSANKLRSALTILGIVIGVAAVIAMLAIGRGAQNSITGSIQGIGVNLLFVMRGGRGDTQVRNPRPLTLPDAQAIGDPLQAPSVIQSTALLQGSAELSFAGETATTQIVGVQANYADVRNESVAEGQFITDEHLLGRASVVLLGPDTAEKLFGRTDDLVGETIRIEGMPFRVIGVLGSKGGSSFGSEDDRALIPLTTAQTRLLRRASIDQVDMILVQAASSEQVTAATEEISQILRQRHRTAVGADDFQVFSQQSILDIAQSVTGVLTIFLGGVAAISLLVGGIGIMNIMLVSVTERTREIGLRKALGARRLSIIIQFLTESALLSLIGGLIGILLGWLISYVVGRVAAAADAAINPAIGLDMILLATLFSTAVGLFFGLYPANRAANLQPVEALRYE
jgi:putative ABC transport system permease protein